MIVISRAVLITLIISLSAPSMSQNYIEYHTLMRKIQDNVVLGNYTDALGSFDTIALDYDFVYAKDCVKALQLAIRENDPNRSRQWFEKSLRQGVPIWFMEMNEITKEYLNTTNPVELRELSKVLGDEYSFKLNLAVKEKVDSLFEVDQQLTDKVNEGFWLLRGTLHNWKWKKNNKRQLAILRDIIERFGYPGEQLIGLRGCNNDSISKSFYNSNGPDFGEYAVEIMLMHCYSNPNKDMNVLLRNELIKGNLSPYTFGIINDYLSKYGKGKFGDYNYYNVWHHDPNDENLIEINARRKEIGLPPFDIQQHYRSIITSLIENQSVNEEISIY